MPQILNDKDLEFVTGGQNDNPDIFPIELNGPYWMDSYASAGGPYTRAVGWTDLKAELCWPGRACPYRIYHGEPVISNVIGWTKEENFTRIISAEA